MTRKPNDGDFADGVAVALSLMSAEWDPYDPVYAEREMSLKNVKGEIEYPYYKHLEMFNDDDNYPSIASILSLDEAID